MNLSFDDKYEENLSIDKDEYIKSLEISIQLLQKEIESLRKKNYSNSEKSNPDAENKSIHSQKNLISNSNSKQELFANINSILEESKVIIDWMFFNIDQNSNLTMLDSSNINESMVKELNNLEEDGVIDWVLGDDKIKIAQSLVDSTDGRIVNNVFVPTLNFGTQSILFFGKSTSELSEFTEEIKSTIVQLIQSFTLKLDNIISLEHINEISKQLEIQKKSKKENYSDLIQIALSEFDQPIQLIESNLDLIDKGIGDSKRRNEIIKENIYNLKELKSKLYNLIFSKSTIIGEFSISDLLEEIKFLTRNQLQRDGISFKIDSKENIKFTGDKNNLESILTYLVILSLDLMPDSGNLFLTILKRKKQIIFKFYYDNAVLTKEEFNKIKNNTNTENFRESQLKILKRIISISEKNKYDLDIINDNKLGTTIQLTI